MSKSSEITRRRAVCLYSGGLDSTTVLYLARSQGYSVSALTFDYGQLHRREIDYCRGLTQELGIRHHLVSVPFPWKGSALLDSGIPLSKNRNPTEMTTIPATYVPARNIVFLSLAASCAEAEDAQTIFIGVNALDYSGYPDCRPEFIQAFQSMLLTGTRCGTEGHPVKIEAPLLKKTKKEIVLLGHSLKVPFEKTWSCYAGQDVPCGECDSCILRAKGFQEAGFEDSLMRGKLK